jgi:hypothetical protein
VKKNTRIILIILAPLLTITSTLPLVLYFYNFHGNLSKDQSDWSNLGSFLSGTSGTILSTCNMLALIYTLYVTITNNEKNNQLTLLSIKNSEQQIKNMEREFSIKLFESHIEAFRATLDKKEFHISNIGPVNKEKFISDAYKRLMIDIWCNLSNTIVENRKGFTFSRPAFIMREFGEHFKNEFRIFFYIIDSIDRTVDEETYMIMLRKYYSQIDIDLLFFMSCYFYTYRPHLHHIFEKNDRKLLPLSERALMAISEAENLVSEGKTPWDIP